MDMFFVVPMVGAGYTPIYVTADYDDAEAMANYLNAAMPDMFEIEGLYGPDGMLNFEMHRDADKMIWADDVTGKWL